MSTKLRTYLWSTVDLEFQGLGDLGYTGSLNDRLFNYLGAQGLVGSLTDRLYAFHLTGGFSPLSLFASGEEGAWYEPSTTTAFTATASGTGFTDIAAASYSDQVAILLDKSQGAGYASGSFTGLGSELVDNGDFELGSTGWTNYSDIGTHTWNYTGGVLTFTRGVIGGAGALQAVSVSTNTTYLVSMDVVSVTGSGTTGGIAAWNGGTFPTTQIASSSSAAGGTATLVFNSGANTSVNIYINCAASTTVVVDNVSVRELPGNHATQVTAGARPILARVPEGGRRNLLTYSNDLGQWSNTGTGDAQNVSGVISPDGGETANSLFESAVNSLHFISAPNASYVSGATYTASAYVKANGRTRFNLTLPSGPFSASNRSVEFDLVAETATPDGTPVGQIEDVGNGWYRCSLTQSAISTATGYALLVLLRDDAGNTTYTGDITKGIYIWGAQLETGSTATAYQKVVSEYDVTEAGVTSLDYLSFEVDDGLTTSSIDFSATDKMSVFAGVERVATANFESIINLGGNPTAENGAFDLYGRNEPGFSYLTNNGGSTFRIASVTSGYPAGTPHVVTATGDLVAPLQTLYVDGSQVATNSDSVPANYRADTLCIGARPNAISPSRLDGKIFGLIVRGAASTANEINQTEAYLANRSGAILPAPPAATGGTETVIDASGTYYRVHTFLDSGTLEVTQDVDVEYLVVAGGGGGGDATQYKVAGGGGGAGGFLTGSTSISTGTYPITVGAGGISGTTTTGIGLPGGSGENSVFSNIVAIGGGGGSGATGTAASGGSGGGGGSPATTPASGTAGQGFGGGAGDDANASSRAGGGGGGASEVGADGRSNASNGYGGDGGDGLASTISGSSSNYAGGGGGGYGSGRPAGSGGLGGGGNGGDGVAGQAGQANTGGGGGGAGNVSSTFTPSSKGGNGGSGIVIVRYEITAADYLAGV